MALQAPVTGSRWQNVNQLTFDFINAELFAISPNQLVQFQAPFSIASVFVSSVPVDEKLFWVLPFSLASFQLLLKTTSALCCSMVVGLVSLLRSSFLQCVASRS